MFKSLSSFRLVMEDILLVFAAFCVLLMFLYEVDSMVSMSMFLMSCFCVSYVIVNKFIRYNNRKRREAHENKTF